MCASKSCSTLKLVGNVGAVLIRMGFGVYYTLSIRSPPDPIRIIKAPT